MFIKLTEQINYKDEQTRVTYVNPQYITCIHEYDRKYYRQVVKEGVTLSEPYEQHVTCISFAVGLHEESDSINVIESMEEVIRLCKEARRA